eukprot:9152549-Pyramimonas_sp.AAC.2
MSAPPSTLRTVSYLDQGPMDELSRGCGRSCGCSAAACPKLGSAARAGATSRQPCPRQTAWR